MQYFQACVKVKLDYVDLFNVYMMKSVATYTKNRKEMMTKLVEFPMWPKMASLEVLSLKDRLRDEVGPHISYRRRTGAEFKKNGRVLMEARTEIAKLVGKMTKQNRVVQRPLSERRK